MPPKGITAVVAITLLLMMTVGAAGMAYIFTTGLQTKTQESASGGVQSLQEAASSCMSVDSVYGNKVYLKNCGSGVITGDSLLAYMDGAPINATMFPAVISKGEVGAVNLSGIWDLSYDKHTLKIGNGLAQVTQRVVAEPRKDDAAGIWRFDEGSGITAYDGSGNGNSGTCYGMGTSCNWTGGKFGGALGFDGVDDYVDAGNGASLKTMNAITTELWFKPNSFGSDSYGNQIFSHLDGCSVGSNGYEIGLNPSNNLLLISISNTNPGDFGFSGLNIGQWTHIVFVWKPINSSYSTQTFYKNGVNTASRDVSVGVPQQINGNVVLGYFQGCWPQRYFNGTIDEVRIYNKALAPDETVNLRVAN